MTVNEGCALKNFKPLNAATDLDILLVDWPANFKSCITLIGLGQCCTLTVVGGCALEIVKLL